MRFILITLLVVLSHPAVIGIDFGTEYFKVSLISPGKSFLVIENTTSKRKTENVISFQANERLYESDGASKRLKQPERTIFFINTLLDQLQKGADIVTLKQKYLLDYLDYFQDNQFTIPNLQIDNEQVTLRIDELLAMIFRQIKKTVDKQHQLSIKDCVITVPSHWEYPLRKIIIDAAVISGLEVLQVINDNTAASVFFAIDRNDTQTALFFNVGAYNAQASIIEFNSTTPSGSKKPIQNIHVLCDSSISGVGGYDYDLRLANYFAEVFDKKRPGKKSIRENPKQFLKLIKQSNKVKEILSSNKDASIHIESLADGMDFSSILDRQTFDTITQDLLEKMMVPIEFCMEQLQMKSENITTIELLGGGIRVPRIQQFLNQYFKKEIGTHLNGDESMSLGASFIAANSSHSFRVKPIHLYEGHSQQIFIRFTNLNTKVKEQPILLFNYKEQFGSKFPIEFDSLDDFQTDILVMKGDQEQLMQSFKFVNVSNFSNVNQSLYKDVVPTVNLLFKSSSVDFVALEYAYLSVNVTETYDYEEKVPIKKEKVVKQEDSESDSETGKDSEDEKQKDNESTESEKKESKKNDKKEDPKFEIVKKTKKRIVTHYIPILVQYGKESLRPNSHEVISSSQKLLKKFDQREENIKKTQELKNKLESLVYQVRDHLEQDTFQLFSSSEERAKLKNLAKVNDEYLNSDESTKADYEVLFKKFTQFNNNAQQVYFRISQAELRQSAVAQFQAKLLDLGQKISNLNKTHGWLNQTVTDSLNEKFEDTQKWITDNIENQKNQPMNIDPVFTVDQLTDKYEELEQEYKKTKSIPKPKKQKPKKEETSEPEKKEEDTEKPDEQSNTDKQAESDL